MMEPSEQKAPVESWVQCDRCTKWRRIPQAVADSLAEDAPWFCEMNTSIYNDCDVPQELTDHQIDQVQEEEDGEAKGRGQKLRKRPPVWQIVKHNIYTHRARKEQDEDDIMICQCQRLWGPPDPKVVGCGPNCLNRMLNIECVTEFCPCGERCSNQMFTRREYAPLDVKRAGAKGFGLFTKNALKAGDFIIEYIGEVLEEEEYHRRKDFYIQTGQRHYYFMNVGNGEVIDACRKGGLGRFINHSCDPNCETQKWLVHGELAIGLFALRDCEAGEELTFDYNFERYGDKPMKCLCASKNCRGIIGGTQESMQHSREGLVPLDSENEPEPIMVTEEEEDRALAAILDRAVGLGVEKGWDARMQRRLAALAVSHGVDMVGQLGVGGEQGGGEEEEEEEEREEEGGSGDEEISEVSSEDERPFSPRPPRKPRQALSEAQGGSEAGEVSAGAAATGSPASSGAKPTGKAPRRQAQGPEGADAAWAEAQAAAALAAKLHVAGSKKQRILAASQAARAAALASQQAPSRKRLKKLPKAALRVAAAAEQPDASAVGPGGGAGPTTSTASQKSGAGAWHRLSRQSVAQQERAAATGSVASTSTAAGGATAATTTPLIPKRSSATHPSVAPSADRTGGKVRRRSEIDRRLDELVGPSGRLRDTSPAAIIRFLRLFNLCDIGPTVSKAEERAVQHRQQPHHAQYPRAPPRPASPALPTPQQQQQSPERHSREQAGNTAAAGAGLGADSRPPSRGAESGGGNPPAAQPSQQMPGVASPGDAREEGEVSPAHSAGDRGAAASEKTPAAAAAPYQQLLQQQRSASPSRDRQRDRDRDRGFREEEGGSRGRSGRDEGPGRSGELSPRQRARLADMSLLLDVVLKTSTLSARREFVKCGILRQLLSTIGHNVGTQYGVILRKVFRVVEALPFTADDLHHTRSAHGSFADLLRELAQHSDYEVRTKAWALLRHYPVKDCSYAPNPRSLPQNAHDGLSQGGGSRGRGWGGGSQWERRDSDVSAMRSPHIRSPPGPDSEPLLSPSYHSGATREGRSPHRDAHQPSRLGGVHRGPAPGGGRPPTQPEPPLRHGGPPREPHPDSRRPYASQPGRPPFSPGGEALPLPPGGRPPFPPSQQQQQQQQVAAAPRGYPGAPPPPGMPRAWSGEEGRDAHAAGAAMPHHAWPAPWDSQPGSGPAPWPAGGPPPPFPPRGPGAAPWPQGGPAGEAATAAVPEAALPSPFAARAVAETIAAALVSSAAGAGMEAGGEGPGRPRSPSLLGSGQGAEGGVAAAMEGGSATRRKRTRWEQQDSAAGPAPSRPSSGGGSDVTAAGAAGEADATPRPSLLPPGFGGAAPRLHSPPPRPPSVLATSMPGRAPADESPSKRAAGAAAADEPPSKRAARVGRWGPPADGPPLNAAMAQVSPEGAGSAGGGGSMPAGRAAQGAAGGREGPGEGQVEEAGDTPMQRLASLLHEKPSWDVETQFAEGGFGLGHAYGASRGAAAAPTTAEPDGGAVAAAAAGAAGGGGGSGDAQQPYSPVRQGRAAAEGLSPIVEQPLGGSPSAPPASTAAFPPQQPASHPMPPVRQPQQGPPPMQQHPHPAALQRPQSGTLSEPSRGDSGSSGLPPPRPQLPPRHPSSLPPHLHPLLASVGPGPANGSLHMSPMTNPSPSSQSLPGTNGVGAEAQETAESALVGDATFFKPNLTVQDESWDQPTPRFERFVGECVRARLGKYVQPGHPARLEAADALQLYRKVAGQVMGKEQEAYAERQRSGLHKPIVRAKLEGKIREFVRDSVRRLLVQRGQGASDV